MVELLNLWKIDLKNIYNIWLLKILNKWKISLINMEPMGAWFLKNQVMIEKNCKLLKESNLNMKRNLK